MLEERFKERVYKGLTKIGIDEEPVGYVMAERIKLSTQIMKGLNPTAATLMHKLDILVFLRNRIAIFYNADIEGEKLKPLVLEGEEIKNNFTVIVRSAIIGSKKGFTFEWLDGGAKHKSITYSSKKEGDSAKVGPALQEFILKEIVKR